MKDAAVADAMDIELLGDYSSTSNADVGSTQEDLVSLFSSSKKGWRRTPTTALRQERQLRALFKQVSTSSPSEIMRKNLDAVEKVLLQKLPQQTASVKSTIIALLEFERFVSVREPENAAEWDATRRRLETWKREACSLDLQREASLQDKLSEDGYLPTRDQLKDLRQKVEAELCDMCSMETNDIRRSDAVKMRRLLTTAILLQNFQRSGTIKNVTIDEYRAMQNAVIRVREHKSSATYGSANLVVDRLNKFLLAYVSRFRALLAEGNKAHLLFPSSDPADDIAEVCRMLNVNFTMTPTVLRKAASTAAFDELDENERRKLAVHMTHRVETQFRAYSLLGKK